MGVHWVDPLPHRVDTLQVDPQVAFLCEWTDLSSHPRSCHQLAGVAGVVATPGVVVE